MTGQRNPRQKASALDRAMVWLIPAAPWIVGILTIVIWEAACDIFALPEFILPRPSEIVRVLVTTAGPIWFHASQNSVHDRDRLHRVGGVRPADGDRGRLGASRLCRLLSVADRFQLGSESGAGADPGRLVRHRHGAGGAHRLSDELLSHRGERGHRARHGRARAQRCAALARREKARSHFEGRVAAFHALFLRLAEDRDHARFRRIGDFRVRSPPAAASAP